MFDIPVLETDRLILRGFRLDDFDALIAMWALPETVRYIGGVPQTREQTWMRLLRHIGMWNAMQFGFWAVTDKASGDVIGQAGFHEMRRDLTPSIENTLEAGTPESFNVLIKEMQSLGLDVKVGGKAPAALTAGLI